MKSTGAIIFCAALLLTSAMGFAGGHELDGAYKFVKVTFQGGSQTEADAIGMIVVHGKHWANVRSAVNRQAWAQADPAEERTKKIVAAYQGLTAGCGTFEIEGNVVTMHQYAGANPAAVGASSKWEYKLNGDTLTLKPLASSGVEFTFQRQK